MDGGYLMLTELFGPIPGDKTVYALAKGQVSIDDLQKPTSAKPHRNRMSPQLKP